ncbi:MAG: hypothetical protein WC508_04465 [Patescibacteria group bacterium]
MTQFEGRQFSTVQDTMPSSQWDKEKFSTDWASQITEINQYFNNSDIKIAQETVIQHFYDTYERLRAMVEEENLDEDEKNKIFRELNLAMVNILEFGQRRNQDIIASLNSRKFRPEEKNAGIFNSLIDILIAEFNEGNNRFHEAQEKAAKNK